MGSKAVVLIRLEMKGDQQEAFSVVDDILDAGVLQDAINENDNAVLKVTSAMSYSVAGAPPGQPKRSANLLSELELQIQTLAEDFTGLIRAELKECRKKIQEIRAALTEEHIVAASLSRDDG